MKKPLKIVMKLSALLILLFNTTSCSKNLFRESADTTDPEALLFEAQRALNKRQYTEAIAIYESLPANVQAKREVNFLLASSYAGRCGLEILDIAFDLQNLSSDQLLKFLMQAFDGSIEDNALDCMGAEGLLTGVGATANLRTVDENLLISFISLAKIGAILSAFADTDVDGEPDAGWDHCVEGDFPETYVREIGTGIAILLESLQAAGADIAGGTVDTLGDVCDQDPALQDICNKTDKTAYTANEVKVLRALSAAENLETAPSTVPGIGVGSCTDLTTDCVCL